MITGNYSHLFEMISTYISLQIMSCVMGKTDVVMSVLTGGMEKFSHCSVPSVRVRACVRACVRENKGMDRNWGLGQAARRSPR